MQAMQATNKITAKKERDMVKYIFLVEKRVDTIASGKFK
jgi:hypothetical protein